MWGASGHHGRSGKQGLQAGQCPAEALHCPPQPKSSMPCRPLRYCFWQEMVPVMLSLLVGEWMYQLLFVLLYTVCTAGVTSAHIKAAMAEAGALTL